jgi:hypothetical protein
MSTIDVKDAAGNTIPLERPLTPGRKDATLSRPVVLSDQDKAAVDALATQTTAAAILAKLIAAPATAANQTTQATSLASILAKIIAAPATEAKQDTGNISLSSIAGLLTTQAGYLDGIEALIAATNAKDFATQTTLAAVLAKIIAAPATEAKQDAVIVQETATATVLGVAADAASATTTIKGALRGIATALGITALDLGSGTGGSRTLRFFRDTAQWIGGAGAVTSAVQRVAIADISNGEYETVAASQTAQALGATGAAGDFIGGLLIIPATTSPGNVLLLDNATSMTVFAGGATSVSNLVPFFVPLGMISVSGAWKVTTGANVSVIGIGNFT